MLTGFEHGHRRRDPANFDPVNRRETHAREVCELPNEQPTPAAPLAKPFEPHRNRTIPGIIDVLRHRPSRRDRAAPLRFVSFRPVVVS